MGKGKTEEGKVRRTTTEKGRMISEAIRRAWTDPEVRNAGLTVCAGPAPLPKCASKRKSEAQGISTTDPKYFNA